MNYHYINYLHKFRCLETLYDVTIPTLDTLHYVCVQFGEENQKEIVLTFSINIRFIYLYLPDANHASILRCLGLLLICRNSLNLV